MNNTTESTSLLPVESINAVEVFQDRMKLNDLLDKIRAETATLVPDVTTDAGRKAIASTAYKVARSKTAIDEAGKAMVEGWKKQAKIVDAERKHARDTLDALRDEVRAPLNEWEEEQARIEQEAVEAARVRREAEEAERLAEIQRREAELAEREAKIAAAEKAEADRLAKIEADRLQAERDEAIRAEAEQAAAEAVEKAKRDAIEAIAGLDQQVKEAEQAAAEAAERAEREKAEAVRQAEERAELEAERREQERKDAEAAERAEEERRAANKRHAGKVHRAAADALIEAGMTDDNAMQTIRLIASGKVPAVSITY